MSYEIRAMGFAEILDTGFRLVRDHFVLLMGCSAVLYVPLGVAFALIERAAGAASGSPDQALQVLAVAIGLAMVTAILSPIIVAAITHALSEEFLGRRATIGGSLRVGLSLLLPILGTSLLSALAVLGATLLFIIPGIWLMLGFMLMSQVVVIERVFGTRALGRSNDLMRGHRLRGLGILFVSALLVQVLQSGVGLMLSPFPGIDVLATSLAQALGYAFTAAVSVLLYFDIRCREEAFDLEHLARVVEGAASGAPVPPSPPAPPAGPR